MDCAGVAGPGAEFAASNFSLLQLQTAGIVVRSCETSDSVSRKLGAAGVF